MELEKIQKGVKKQYKILIINIKQTYNKSKFLIRNSYLFLLLSAYYRNSGSASVL